MTEQLPLIVEDYYEALAATVAALGGPKKVGAELRPELPIDQAGRWLSDCCNSARDHELKPNQLALIRKKARAAGFHILATFEMREAGYQAPQPLVIEDEMAKATQQLDVTMQRAEVLLREVLRWKQQLGRSA